jgi:hypothetical protein
MIVFLYFFSNLIVNLAKEEKNMSKVIHCRYCNFPNEYAQAENDGKYCCWECSKKENKSSDNNEKNNEDLYILKFRYTDGDYYGYEIAIGIYTYDKLNEVINNHLGSKCALVYSKEEINKRMNKLLENKYESFWAHIPKKYEYNINEIEYKSYEGQNLFNKMLKILE